ncbi:hypothetical protein DPMN_097840 [Dreissena polymorpha]|uniref:Uncharacterized protein n=1 Tax=Dreissena polymorpha TaxID=45954 RepID=A0A9D4LB05_DREPO|nr:hypothetical protein DPMN_097840 [Dreissena polymorpha]
MLPIQNKAVCETTLSRNDIDSIDNDCDGQIDEETCYPGYGVYPTGTELAIP